MVYMIVATEQSQSPTQGSSQIDFKHVGLSRESRALRPSLPLDFSSDETLPSLRIPA